MNENKKESFRPKRGISLEGIVEQREDVHYGSGFYSTELVLRITRNPYFESEWGKRHITNYEPRITIAVSDTQAQERETVQVYVSRSSKEDYDQKTGLFRPLREREIAAEITTLRFEEVVKEVYYE